MNSKSPTTSRPGDAPLASEVVPHPLVDDVVDDLAHDLAHDRALRQQEAIAFVLEVGSALHRVGTPAHRLETAMCRISDLLGLKAQFFSTPTAIFAGFGDVSRQQTSLVRLEPGIVNLGRLARVDEIVNAVIDRSVSLGTGAAAIRGVMAAPGSVHPVVVFCMHVVAAGVAARFFGGGYLEMALGSGIGVLVGILDRLMNREVQQPPPGSTSISAVAHLERTLVAAAPVFVPLAAAVVVASAALCAHWLPGVSPTVLLLAGVLPLLPGLTLTTGMNELSTRHLTSGTARLTAAGLTFIQLAFGVAIGGRVGDAFPPLGPPVEVVVSEWLDLAAIVVGSTAYATIFSAMLRDYAWIVASGAIAYLGARFGSSELGPELGAFVGSFAVGVFANLYSRWRSRPATVLIVPGILLLVPGSVGFKGVSSLLARDAAAGVNLAFSAVFIAISIVAGLMLSNAVVPSKKVL